MCSSYSDGGVCRYKVWYGREGGSEIRKRDEEGNGFLVAATGGARMWGIVTVQYSVMRDAPLTSKLALRSLLTRTLVI